MTTSSPKATASKATGVNPWASIPFHRLLLVEARKLFDTRSAKVMTALLIALLLASIAGRGITVGPKLQVLIGTAGIGLGTLLPVLSIIAVTSEWNHRTVLTTFTLEPRRARVVAAKSLPPLITAVAGCALAILIAVPVTAAVAGMQGVPADWSLTPRWLVGWTVTMVLVVAMAVALATLLMSAPAPIVICLSTPVLWTAVGNLGSTGEVLADWLDLNTTAVILTSGDITSVGGWRLAVAIAVWIVIPMALGVLRTVRKDVH